MHYDGVYHFRFQFCLKQYIHCCCEDDCVNFRQDMEEKDRTDGKALDLIKTIASGVGFLSALIDLIQQSFR